MNEGEIRGTLTPRIQLNGSISLPKTVTGDNYLDLLNKPSINGETLIGDKSSEDLHIVACKTSAEWAELTDLVSREGEIYVYSDAGANGEPMVKIGDGNAYVVDLPFTAVTDFRITDTDIQNWNNKVAVRIEGDRLIFY